MTRSATAVATGLFLALASCGLAGKFAFFCQNRFPLLFRPPRPKCTSRIPSGRSHDTALEGNRSNGFASPCRRSDGARDRHPARRPSLILSALTLHAQSKSQSPGARLLRSTVVGRTKTAASQVA
ncbi:unnamed protein product, partial [Discosporangium mesarthrocarpum]